MVMVTSLAAATALFAVFFGGLAVAPKGRVTRVVGALGAALGAGLAWTAVVILGRPNGWVLTEEAQFHHLYILGVVGLPVVGAVLLIASFVRPVKDRRARMGGRVIAAAFVLPALVGVYATNIEPVWLRVDHETVGGGGAVKVAVVADVQTDQFGDYERRVMEAAVAEEPDVILVAGDLTQVAPEDYRFLEQEAAETIGLLDAPGGVFVVSGNTDPGVTSIAELSQEAGAAALDDSVAEIDVDGHRVRILGLSWPNNRRAAVIEAITRFEQGSSEESIDIVLAHSPDVIFNRVDADAVDLIVVGHTHGGQISVPFYGPIWNVTELPREVAAGGLHVVSGVPMYVSTGVGVNRGESPKVRFGVRPSIGVLDIG